MMYYGMNWLHIKTKFISKLVHIISLHLTECSHQAVTWSSCIVVEEKPVKWNSTECLNPGWG